MTIFRTFSEQEDHFVLKTLPLKDNINCSPVYKQMWEKSKFQRITAFHMWLNLHIFILSKFHFVIFHFYSFFVAVIGEKMFRFTILQYNFHNWGNKISRPVAIAFSNSKPKFEWKRMKRSLCATQLLYKVFLQYNAARKSEGRRPWTTHVSKKLR